MSRVNTLELEWRSGPRRPHLVAAEFVLDGRPLREHCERASGQVFDLVSPFGWTPPEHQLALARRLLLREPPELPSGRYAFLVCPECADLGCGCVSAAVRIDGGFFVWEEFGYENDHDPSALRLFPMGRFVVPEPELAIALGRIVPECV